MIRWLAYLIYRWAERNYMRKDPLAYAAWRRRNKLPPMVAHAR